MLRSSEIKPLFVDLSLCDKSFSFSVFVPRLSFMLLAEFFLSFFPRLSSTRIFLYTLMYLIVGAKFQFLDSNKLKNRNIWEVLTNVFWIADQDKPF